MLTTDCLCCIGCSDLKLRCLSEWVGLRYTDESKWPLGERLTRRSKNGRHPSFSFSIVNWMEFSILFRCVKNSDNFDLVVITKVSSTYLFHKRGGSVKVSRARVSMSSMTSEHCPEEAHLNRWAKRWLIMKYNHQKSLFICLFDSISFPLRSGETP